MNNRIAITGASGFIGSYFIKHNTRFSILPVDLHNKKLENFNFNGIDTVIHLAALVHQPNNKNDEQYYQINRDLAFETAKKAKLEGVTQFVFMSTAKVYGESTINNIPWDESSKCSPMDAYGKSKLEGEELVKGLEDSFFRVAIIRSPLVYGEGVKANMYNLIKLIDRFPCLPFGNVNNKRSMVYVGNLSAMINQIVNLHVSGIFIAADQEPLSTSHLCLLISRVLNKKVRLIIMPKLLRNIFKLLRPSIENRLYGSLYFDNSRTNRVLNFSPPFSSEQGIILMVNEYINSKQ